MPSASNPTSEKNEGNPPDKEPRVDISYQQPNVPGQAETPESGLMLFEERYRAILGGMEVLKDGQESEESIANHEPSKNGS